MFAPEEWTDEQVQIELNAIREKLGSAISNELLRVYSHWDLQLYLQENSPLKHEIAKEKLAESVERIFATSSTLKTAKD